MNRAYRANRSAVLHTERLKRLAASSLAIAVCLAPCGPAIADITNTVTVTGSSPGNANDVTAADTENVSPVLAAPGMSVTKVFSFTDTGSAGAEPGDVITYTYSVTNSGNTYLRNVSLADAHQGAGALGAVQFAATPLTDNNTVTDSTDDGTDAVWDVLAPGDAVNFTATYTVQAGDLTAPGAVDGDIDNTATASGTYDNGTVQTVETAQASAELPLYLNRSLAVDKVASFTDTGAPGAEPGDVITYTYTVTNTGNVPVTAITLSDTDNSASPDLVPAFVALVNTSGNSSNPENDSTVEVLWPGDQATFTATLTVTQTDVDTLQ